MTREEVLDEFGSAACENECEAGDCISERKMADEIVRLRTRLAELNADRDLTFRIAEHNGQEAIKANAILAKLREPSTEVLEVGALTMYRCGYAAPSAVEIYKTIVSLVRAAVTAAEQEVANV